MVKLDNPVRIARLGKRLSQKELARQAGVARMTLVSIEEGTTRTPDHETLDAIAQYLGQDTDALARSLNDWRDRQPQASYDRGRIRDVADRASSFKAFRLALEPSATRFAADLGVARGNLTGYEAGRRKNGMPDTLQAGLLAIGADLPTVRKLESLPPHD